MIVVEVLGRRGETVERVRLTAFPATLGRAWSNDVVLADPTVEAQHARIAVGEDGLLAIEDLGSVNGMRRDGARERVQRLVLNGQATVRLGRATLRIVDAAQPVPPALVEVVPTGRLAGLLAAPRAMLAVSAAVLLLAVPVIWLESYQSRTASIVAETAVGLLFVALLWAGIWSLIGRFTVHQFRFLQHLTVMTLALLALWLLGVLLSWSNFLFPTRWLFSAIEEVAGAVLIVALLVTHLGLVMQHGRKLRRILIASLITAVFYGLALIGDAATESDFSASVTIPDQLKPVPASLIPAGDIDGFIEGTNGLKETLDRQASD